jgi:hypothetical protein
MGRCRAPGRLVVLSSLVIALVIQPATTWSQTPSPFAPLPPETPAAAPHLRAVDAVRDAAAGTLTVAGGVAAQLTWRPCATTALLTRECAEFVVPLNYREPQGATISLAVARMPATDPAARLGSLFLNPGGPGNSGLQFLPGMYAALLPAVSARFDIVAFDPRGIGESAPVRCFASPAEQAAFMPRVAELSGAVPRVAVGADEEAALLRAIERGA